MEVALPAPVVGELAPYLGVRVGLRLGQLTDRDATSPPLPILLSCGAAEIDK